MNKYSKKENYVFNFSDDWNRSHNKSKIIEQYSDILKGNVAEMGCNSGYHCFIIAENQNVGKVIGFDINEKSLTFANDVNRKKFSSEISKKVSFINTDLTKVDYDDSYFDVLISFHTLEHIFPEDLKNVLKEKYRVLKKDGKLLISLPYKNSFDCEQHVNYFDLDKIEKELLEVNFIKEELYIDKRMGDTPQHFCITGVFKKKLNEG